MAEEIGLESLAFVAIALFAFLWTVRLAFNVRKSLAEKSKAWHERLDSLEDLAIDLRKEADELKAQLGDKIDASYLEKRISGLVELVHGSKTRARSK